MNLFSVILAINSLLAHFIYRCILNVHKSLLNIITHSAGRSNRMYTVGGFPPHLDYGFSGIQRMSGVQIIVKNCHPYNVSNKISTYKTEPEYALRTDIRLHLLQQILAPSSDQWPVLDVCLSVKNLCFIFILN